MAETVAALGLFDILVRTIQDISFWTGLVTIAAFSQGRFNEKQLDYEELDPPLPARCFTSRFRYYSAAALYTGAFAAFYTAMIVIGSVPQLQGVLKELFGSLNTVENRAQIGTPAWAAMVLMMVAPTLPWFRRAEFTFRLWLQDFSDIPYKARILAEDILSSLYASRGGTGDIEQATDSELTNVFADLQGVRVHMLEARTSHHNDRYLRAFLPHEDLLKRTVQRFSFIVDELNVARREHRGTGKRETDAAPADPEKDDPPEAPTTRELLVLARRYARLIACILLQVEAEEFYARQLLRRIPGLQGVQLSDFQFHRSQVFLGIAVIITIASLTGPSVSMFINTGFALSPGDVRDMLVYWFWWGVTGSVAFILPLTFAAAVQLYLINRTYDRDADESGVGIAATLLMGFFGYYGLAVLPIAAVEAWRATATGVSLGLFQVMLWALPPAIVSLLYNCLSFKNFSQSRSASFLIDLAIFAVIAAIVSSLIVAFNTLRTLSDMGAHDFGLFPSLMHAQMGEIVTVTVVAGIFGAMQCIISRTTQCLAQARQSHGAKLVAPVPQSA